MCHFQAEKIAYSEEVTNYDQSIAFPDMNLSRPLLKVRHHFLKSFRSAWLLLPPIFQAVANMGFTQPTPIQAATIPVALLGKDICACAATGTGKHTTVQPSLLGLVYYHSPTQVKLWPFCYLSWSGCFTSPSRRQSPVSWC